MTEPEKAAYHQGWLEAAAQFKPIIDGLHKDIDRLEAEIQALMERDAETRELTEKQDFINRWAKSRGMTEEEWGCWTVLNGKLHARICLQCRCGDDICDGWIMEHPDSICVLARPLCLRTIALVPPH